MQHIKNRKKERYGEMGAELIVGLAIWCGASYTVVNYLAQSHAIAVTGALPATPTCVGT